MTVEVPPEVAADVEAQVALQRRLLERVWVLPGVERASAVGPPFQSARDRRTAWAVEAISTDFFATTGIVLMLGRPFVDRDDSNGPPVAIVSESLARRLWPQRSPLGERLLGGAEEPPRTVVGVVSDTRLEPDGPMRDVAYVPQAQTGGRGMTLLVKSPGDLVGLGKAVAHAIAALDRRLRIVEHTLLEDPCEGRERCWRRVDDASSAAM